MHRLILIAEKDTVYDKFPTPLINRLEKHFVLTSSILEYWQSKVLSVFEIWIQNFSRTRYSQTILWCVNACSTLVRHCLHNFIVTIAAITSVRPMLSLATRRTHLQQWCSRPLIYCGDYDRTRRWRARLRSCWGLVSLNKTSLIYLKTHHSGVMQWVEASECLCSCWNLL